MSIEKKPIKRYIFLGVAGSTIWFAACSMAWVNSRASGGFQLDKARDIVHEVSQSINLTPACYILGVNLAERALASRETQMLPTFARMKAREIDAAERYETNRCPISAMAVISYGVAEKSSDAEMMRSRNRVERW